MNQTSNAPDRLWQGLLGALLLGLVMFSEGIIGSDIIGSDVIGSDVIGSDKERSAPAAATQPCDDHHCNHTALAGH